MSNIFKIIFTSKGYIFEMTFIYFQIYRPAILKTKNESA